MNHIIGKPVFNPYLPSYEYVPDGEPHIFGDRLYVFGSHDAFGGRGFCLNDYVCYSAPLSDLSDWKFEGVIYPKDSDPKNRDKKQNMNAPDVIRGKDGRYYLYYQLDRECITSVAVCDTPAGGYRFYGYVKWPDGTAYGKKKGDAYNFDPGLLTDDDGSIYMYTGFAPASAGFRFIMGLHGGTFSGGSVVRLSDDMLTIEGDQVPTVPGEHNAVETEFSGHGFFEASSPRKIGGRYYLVYSSVLSHELCYAVSDSPTGIWHYGGTIVSIGDIGLPGVRKENARNFLGNTHGGLVCIDKQWYIFYHRQTNMQKCCRQGCAEPIMIDENGHISQAEITSCGLNKGPLPAKGTYEARIACNLKGKDGVFAYTRTRHKETGYPYFTQSGTDREDSGDQYIANMKDGAVAGFKYFEFRGETRISVTVRGEGKGKFIITTEENGAAAAQIELRPGSGFETFSTKLPLLQGRDALYFTYQGEGYVDFREFSIE